MQESLAEISLAQLPLVVLNMARAQGDYYQATRGGGHGDYRHPVLAPMDVAEAVALVQLAFHLARQWRNPVLVFGDYYLAHTTQSVAVERVDFGPLPPADWALDGDVGRLRQRPSSCRRSAPPSGATTSATTSPSTTCRVRAGTTDMVAGIEPLADVGFVDDAEVVVVAFGTPGALRPRRGAAACATTARRSAGCARSRCSRSRPTRSAAAADGARAGRRLREQPGPDDRRRAPRGARAVSRCSSSAGSASTARASASRPTSRSPPCAAASRRCSA